MKYEHPFISVGNIYGKPRSVRKRGAAVRLTVPSETPGHSSHDFDWERVPIALTKHRMVLAYGPYTTLSSHGHKRNIRLAFSCEDGSPIETQYADIDPIVSTEIAGYWRFAEFFANLSPDDLRKYNKRRNFRSRDARLVPLETCQFRMPNQNMVDFYLKMLNRVIVMYRDQEGREVERGLTTAEQEIFLSVYVGMQKNGIWDTFFLPGSQRLGKLHWMDRPTREYRETG